VGLPVTFTSCYVRISNSGGENGAPMKFYPHRKRTPAVAVASCGTLSDAANRRGYPPCKPLPAKRIPAQIRSLCRSYTGEAVRSLAAIMRNPDAPTRARIRVADILLDRGWGKPSQPRTDEGLRDVNEGHLFSPSTFSTSRGALLRCPRKVRARSADREC
jgi:hypothetical protein